jgi:hypothetical protein
MNRITWITHKGKKILSCDYQGAPTEEIIKSFKIANNTMFRSPVPLLVLSDFSDTEITGEAVRYLKNAESRQAAEKMKKSAVLGIDGVKRVLLNFYNAANGGKARAFGSREEALDWLVAD